MEICVAPWEEKDIEEIARCEAACFAKPYTNKDIQELYVNGYTHGFIARFGGEFAGYASFMAVYESGDVLRVAVYPAFRRKGLARALMQETLAQAAALGVEKIFLDVRTSNVAAIALYEGFGFEKIGLRKKYYENGEDAYTMARTIEK